MKTCFSFYISKWQMPFPLYYISCWKAGPTWKAATLIKSHILYVDSEPHLGRFCSRVKQKISWDQLSSPCPNTKETKKTSAMATSVVRRWTTACQVQRSDSPDSCGAQQLLLWTSLTSESRYLQEDFERFPVEYNPHCSWSSFSFFYNKNWPLKALST